MSCYFFNLPYIKIEIDHDLSKNVIYSLKILKKENWIQISCKSGEG